MKKFIYMFLVLLLFAGTCFSHSFTVRLHAEAAEVMDDEAEDTADAEGADSDDAVSEEDADEASEEEDAELQEGPYRYEKLDDAFAADEVIFVLDESDDLLDFDELIITDEVIEAYGLRPDDVAMAEEESIPMFIENQVSPAYVSPTGISSLYCIGGTPAAVYDGTLRVLYPSAERGAEDTYGKLTGYIQRFEQLIKMGVPAWSHDGRYAVLSAFNLVMRMDPGFMDPTIIDLTTGELIITEAFGDDIKSDGKILCAACFSPDDRYLYYLMYGFYDNGNLALYRYEMETGINEQLMVSDMTIDLPFLYMNEKEELYYPVKGNPEPGIGFACLKEEDGVWTEEFIGAENLFSNHKTFLYSDNSTYAIQSMYILNNKLSCFQIFTLNDGITGDEPYWAIRFDENAETAELVELDKEAVEFKGTSDELEEAREEMADFLPVQWVMLSPDGYYAFLYYGQVDGGRLVVVSLESMETVLAKIADESGVYIQAAVPSVGAYSTYLSPVVWYKDKIRVSMMQSDEVIRGELR